MRIQKAFDPLVIQGIFVYGGGGDSYASNCVPKLYTPSTIKVGERKRFLLKKTDLRVEKHQEIFLS